MAKTLSVFPGNHRGRPPIYDWEKFTNGEVWQLTRGVDFNSDPRSFRTLVHRKKKQWNLGARTRIHDDESITIQFWPKPLEETS